jgi:hypothetical protein
VGSLGEDYLGGYHLDLAVTVARMENPRAYRALLSVIDNWDVITTGIAAGGELALADVIAILGDPKTTRRHGAALTLGKISSRATELGLSAGGLKRIRGALLAGIRNETDFLLRMGSIRGLRAFDDEELRIELARIAKTDQATIAGRYPVREEAEKWLASRR